MTHPEIDPSRPSSARFYDYVLGGKNYFTADRELGEAVMAQLPALRTVARENRRFLGRAVRYLAREAGVRQFLDIGSGLPSTENVHEVAQRVAPSSRVVYVDNDPQVMAHARALLRSAPEGRTAYIQADLRDPERILSDPATRDVLDFTQPVALMMVSVLPFVVAEDQPEKILATLLDSLPPGSYLAATHPTAEHDAEGCEDALRVYRSRINATFRTSDEFARLAFADLDLVPPGVVLVSEWRPDSDGPFPSASEVSCYGGVARKP